MLRTLEKSLTSWSQSPIRKPLIIRGARQVGKTSLVRQLKGKLFRHIIEINLEKLSNLQAYDDAKNLEELLFRISKYTNTPIIPGSTLLFFDEIQASPNLIHMLRFFAEERPDLHVISAGSLLESRLSSISTFPVGRVDFRFLYPLTFTEFLKAVGESGLVEILTQVELNTQVSLHSTLNDWYQKYMMVGGMPEIVAYYAEKRDYSGVEMIINRLLTAYQDDLRKYVPNNDLFKYYEGVLEVGPKIAGTIFNYENFGGLAYRSREMSEALNTMEKVMILYQVKAINHAEAPLLPKLKRPKKLIWLDAGLVSFRNRYFEIQDDQSYKGRLMEQIVGQQILARSQDRLPELYYWSRDKDEGSAEVDFAFQYQGRIIALEVKSGNSQQMKSLFSLIKLHPEVVPVRVSWEQPGIENYTFNGENYRVLAIPFYCLDRITEIVNRYC